MARMERVKVGRVNWINPSFLKRTTHKELSNINLFTIIILWFEFWIYRNFNNLLMLNLIYFPDMIYDPYSDF